MREPQARIVAVTGAGGLVGRVLTRHLAQAGFAIRILSRTPKSAPDFDSKALPPFDAPGEAFDKALAGATHVVHAAGLTNADPRTTETDFMNANAALTERLANAAARVTPGSFIFLSSIRAVIGHGSKGIVGAETRPAPICAYGRSKLAGEAAAGAAYSGARARQLTILRPAPVYGAGMKGNLGRLLQLARTPYPLPLAGLQSRRSLLDAEALARAVVHVLTVPDAGGSAYIVSDAQPITIQGIVRAFRIGMGRAPNLFAVPPSFLQLAASLAGKRQIVQGLFADEICDPSSLAATGWAATENSAGGLAALVR